MSARKKTPFQKHREEEEAKKKAFLHPFLVELTDNEEVLPRLFPLNLISGFLQRAEDETARLYQEFVESFQADNTPGSKAFVRGGTINPNDKLKNDLEGQLQFCVSL